MEIIMNVPYVARVLTSLLVILIINKISKGLSLSIMAGIALLALWTGKNFHSSIAIAWNKFSSPNNLFLVAVIFQVIWLSKQMSSSGVMQDLVESINSRVSRRVSMALLPAVIGLLPMPGGAIFSAPLIDESDREKKIDPLLKTQINYWFRHVWEYWWPLYPGVLLAIEITGLPILNFLMIMLPLSIISVFAGYLFLLRRVENSEDSRNRQARKNISHIITLLTPIFIIIFCFGIIHIFIPVIPSFNKYLPMIMGITLAQLILQIQRPLGIRKWKEIIISLPTLIIVVVVVLVLLYGAYIEAPLLDGSLIMDHVRHEIAALGIPVILIIALIPFIAGMTTGVAVGFVGASFPIVMSLIGVDGGTIDVLSATVLAYASGYMGMILSPVHVCLIVTNEYFKTGIIESLVKLIRPALVVMSGSVLVYAILQLFR